MSKKYPKWLEKYLNGLDNDIARLKRNKESTIAAYEREKEEDKIKRKKNGM